jgi:hypothetical protein
MDLRYVTMWYRSRVCDRFVLLQVLQFLMLTHTHAVVDWLLFGWGPCYCDRNFYSGLHSFWSA